MYENVNLVLDLMCVKCFLIEPIDRPDSGERVSLKWARKYSVPMAISWVLLPV
jgi:hypothetical protein